MAAAALGPADVAASGMAGHNLRFLNDEWNDSISNGVPFTLRWNQSLAKTGAQLGLFRVTYPHDGVVIYELVSNLTESIDAAQCVWTPDSLGGELYALWLTNGRHAHANWTMSPSWVLKGEQKANTGGPRMTWAAPIVIPVVCLLVLYAICLSVYLLFRRRKKAKREEKDATPHQDVGRNNSVDSAMTVQTYTMDANDFKEKYGQLRSANSGEIWIFTNSLNDTEPTVGGSPDKDVATSVERVDEADAQEHHDGTIGIGL